MQVVAWHNSDGNYAIKVPHKEINNFPPPGGKIDIAIRYGQGIYKTCKVNIPSRFGASCHELFQAQINHWISQHMGHTVGTVYWPKGKPPKYVLTKIPGHSLYILEK